MGVLNYLLIGHASEADAIAASDEPSQTWDGFGFRGLDPIKLATLWALVETGSPDDRLEQRLDQVRTIPEGDQGPWIDVLPTKMVASLASIAAMEEGEQESLAEQWGQTDELQGWEEFDILDLVRSIGDTAETAQLENESAPHLE